MAWFSTVQAMLTLGYPNSPQSGGRQDSIRSILFVMKKKERSLLIFIISQASARQGSASSTKKSEVKQVSTSEPWGIL